MAKIGKNCKIEMVTLTSAVGGSHQKFYITVRDNDTHDVVTAYGRLHPSMTVADIVEQTKLGNKFSGCGKMIFDKMSDSEFRRHVNKVIDGRVNNPSKYLKKDGGVYTRVQFATEDDIPPVALAITSEDSSTTIKGALGTYQLDTAVYDFLRLVNDSASGQLKLNYSGSLSIMKPTVIKSAKEIVTELSRFSQTQWTDNTWSQLSKQQRDMLAENVTRFYQLIPSTQVDTRHGTEGLVNQFMNWLDAGQQWDTITNLETAIEMKARELAGGSTIKDEILKLYDNLGVVLLPVPRTNEVFTTIENYFRRETNNGRRSRWEDPYKLTQPIEAIFLVEIPSERERFLDETFGDSYIMSLFHSTGFHNMRNILDGGLKILPPSYRRRFGDGTYYTAQPYRSYVYGSNYSGYRVHILNHVKVGNPMKQDGTKFGFGLSDIQKTPYHSVYGVGERSGKGDEWVTYKESQGTISAIILYRDNN